MTTGPPPGGRARSRRVRRAVAATVILFAAWWLAGLIGALLLTQGSLAAVGARSELGGRPVEAVATTTSDGLTVRGWLVRAATAATRCVVLLPGIHANRLALLPRAEWYLAHGWSALLVDLRGTGESDHARISMGWHESLDLLAWFAFLRERGFTAIGAHGQSLGAAAIVFTAVRDSAPPPWHFVVLEACYVDIDAALSARLPVPACVRWPLVVCGEWLMHARAEDLRPEAAIRSLTVPTLVVAGAADGKIGPDAAARLLSASAATDKRRFEVAGAGHVDLWGPGGADLQRTLGEFLAGR